MKLAGPEPGEKGTPSRIQTELQAALTRYRKIGLKPSPLVRFGKKPVIHWSEESAVAGARFTASNNIGLLCDNGLVVQDFESEADFRTFYPNQEKLMSQTLVVSTPHGGVHVYWIDLDPAQRTVRLFGNEHPVDFCGIGGYIVAPPSVLDHARCDRSKCLRQDRSAYTVISSSTDIATITNGFTSTIRRGKSLGWRSSVPETLSRNRRINPSTAKLIRGTLSEDPPCVSQLLKGVNAGTRDWAAFLLGNYYASWRGMDGDSVVELLLDWNKRNNPPLPDSEIRAKFGRLGKYTIGCKAFLPWCNIARCNRPLDRLLRASSQSVQRSESQSR
jgi:hypothetical protein